MTETEPDHLVSIGDAVDFLQNQFPDVSHSSLRFLEREGLISSSRTAGGHRLYAKSDIDQVALIKRWQREGQSLQDIRQLLLARNQLLDPALLSDRFLELALASQLEQAGQLILQADRVGMEPEVIFLSVLQPALFHLGELWAAGKITVHQEKEVSVLCRELVAEITLRHSPGFPTGSLFVSACVAGEQHEIGICMVNGLLRQRGHRVRYLGPDVATVFLEQSIGANQPDAVLLSSSVEESYDGCMEAVKMVRATYPGNRSPLVIVGGSMSEERASELAGLGAMPMGNERLMREIDDLLAAVA